MNRNKSSLTARAGGSITSSRAQAVQAFLDDLKKRAPASRGRLIFGLDATASRQPTWDAACTLTAEMFREAGAAGGLEMQLVYFRGDRECKASRWFSSSADLTNVMTRISCAAGETQIEKILDHAIRDTKVLKVNALVLVGDAMEENADMLVGKAAELGRLGVRSRKATSQTSSARTGRSHG